MARKSWRRRAWVSVLVGLLMGLGASITPVLAVETSPAPPALSSQENVWKCMQVSSGVGLNVRAGPGTRYSVLLVLNAGVQVDAATERTLEIGGYTWVPIRLADGRGGWSVAERFVPCPNSPTASTGDFSGTAWGAAVDGGAGSVLTAINQDGALDHDEIAAIAQAVVLLDIETPWEWASGTGTLISPDGIIVTNAHVVEDAETITVYVLEDVNAQPVPRYQGTVLVRDEDLDVAIVSITADRNGGTISPTSLALPYLPLQSTPQEMYRGDEVYIFGYPGIGDAYLVLTRGGIVSVEGGTLDGEPMPLWYRTDAEIAPGNSGGLAVDGNGRFVGIPTFVESEDVTGGRLGGIRAAPVVLRVLADHGFTATN